VAGTETSPARRDPDALEKDIQRTREELARTIDAIADRVSPAKAARRAVNRVRDEVARIDPKVAAAGAAVVVGVAAFIIWRRSRR
jgi:type VI protein secretion system component VasF